jgi:hypothetical protein
MIFLGCGIGESGSLDGIGSLTPSRGINGYGVGRGSGRSSSLRRRAASCLQWLFARVEQSVFLHFIVFVCLNAIGDARIKAILS